jgi:hypothetical protein
MHVIGGGLTHNTHNSTHKIKRTQGTYGFAQLCNIMYSRNNVVCIYVYMYI